MKALTIHQPYASWIMDGAKWVENRTWATGYRGPLAIHAGLNQAELRRLKCLGQYPTGLILGTVQLVAVETLARLQELALDYGLDYHLPGVRRELYELLRHRHLSGPVCWILEDVVRFDTPIAAKGQRGLWELDMADSRQSLR